MKISEKPINPFGINRYIGPEWFCDRIDETNQLLSNIAHGKHTACFALRRLGKTALIQHVFHSQTKKRGYNTLYLDIYATQNLQDFTNMLANAIYKLYPEPKGIGKTFWEFIKLFRPVISLDELSGTPQLSLDIAQPKQYEKTLPQLLQFLDQQKTKTVIALDEFQQILHYPEKNIEALLRTSIQQLKQTTFIFSGSNQSMMSDIFLSAKRPFYTSCAMLHLHAIPREAYCSFIKDTFEKYKFRLDETVIHTILDLTSGYTYYTQRVCHELLQHGLKRPNEDTAQSILSNILIELQPTYFQYRNLLTPGQWQLLKAIAMEECVVQPYSKNFIQKHKLGSAAIVKRSLEALRTKEMIYCNLNAEVPYWSVYDKFLMRWLQYI